MRMRLRRVPAPAVKAGLDLFATLVIIAVGVVVLWRLLVPAKAAGNARTTPKTTAQTPAPVPEQPVSLAGAAVKGAPTARVAVVEYSDFQCPYCGVFARDTLPALEEKYVSSGQVLLAFRHLPLESIHPVAREAAELAECARLQQRFWPLHDRFFQQQKALAGGSLGQYAQAVGLEPRALDQCLKQTAPKTVSADAATAKAYSISGTPTFFIGSLQTDGRVKVTHRFSGARSLQDFSNVIDRLLSASQEDR